MVSHVVVWLATGEVERLSATARAALSAEEPVASPMAMLEMQFLHEIGRVRPDAATLMALLTQEIGLRPSDTPFGSLALAARHLAWTRDPFDRIIVANALADGARLLTKDPVIRKNVSQAVW